MKINSNNLNNYNEISFTSSNFVSKDFDIHFHNGYEIYYFISGDADYLVEGKQYKLTPNSLILLSPNVLHGVRVNSDRTYIRCATNFSPEEISMDKRAFLLSCFPGNKKNPLKEVFYENTEIFNLQAFLKNLVSYRKFILGGKDVYYETLLEGILAQISIMCNVLSPSNDLNVTSDTILDIITYLNNNLANQISLEDISNKFLISKHYMNKLFKQATGTTIIDYLIYKRIIYAKNLILNGNSITEAAAQSGFNEYSTFYRAYVKVTGKNPKEDII